MPLRVLFFLTSLRSFSSSPLGNLQTMFALPSLAASVVNKKNQKDFRAHPCGMLWPCLPLGWAGFSGVARLGISLIISAPTGKISAQRNKAERTRGRPIGPTSAKVLWVPFFQERYGS
ncbi:hypothetical protein, partial [uncultured Rikenella sp.]|uniref:hypothetical protein n=1 Tax=uncultured Rikenella sp. TaxID=368003 RepID=UPI0026325A82